MDNEMLGHIYEVVKALSFACHEYTHLLLYDDGSGKVIVDSAHIQYGWDNAIRFVHDSDIRELACQWFFEDYEPFNVNKETVRSVDMMIARIDDVILELKDDDEPSQWDDLNKYMGGYA